MGTEAVIASAVTLLMVLGVLWDLRWRRLPNWLTLGGAAAGLLLSVMNGGVPGALGSVGGWLLGVALLLLPFAVGAMGAGDVKLLAAVGALKGASFVFMAFLYGAIAGGVLALALLLLRGELLGTLKKLFGGLTFVFGSLLRFGTVPNLGMLATAAVAEGDGGVAARLARAKRPALPYGVAIAAGALIALALGY